MTSIDQEKENWSNVVRKETIDGRALLDLAQASLEKRCILEHESNSVQHGVYMARNR